MKTRQKLAGLKIGIWLGCFLLTFVSCKSRQAITQPAKIVELEKNVTKTIRDTTFIVQPDSSFYKAWIECINGKPVIRRDTAYVSNWKPEPILKPPTVSLSEGGELLVGCETEILELRAQIEDLVTEVNSKTVEYITVEVERELTFWQRLFIGLGRVLFFGLIAAAVYGIIKLYLKIYVK